MTERNGGLMTNEEAIKLLSQIMDALLASNSWLPSTKNPIKESFGMAISALTAQDEKRTEERTETHGVCLDVIDRQATLDWLKNEWNGMITSLFDGIKALPSAQPEIIRCKECKYNSNTCGNYVNCDIIPQMFGRTVDNFCSMAERRANDPD